MIQPTAQLSRHASKGQFKSATKTQRHEDFFDKIDMMNMIKEKQKSS
jgi:hypothetical protein